MGDKCSRVRLEINSALDAMVPFNVNVREHLRNCSSCNLYARKMENLGSVLCKEAREFNPEPTVDLVGKTMHELEEKKSGHNFGSGHSWKRYLAAAAILIVFLSGLSFYGLRKARKERLRQQTIATIKQIEKSIDPLFTEYLPRHPNGKFHPEMIFAMPLSMELDYLRRDTINLGHFLLRRIPCRESGRDLNKG